MVSLAGTNLSLSLSRSRSLSYIPWVQNRKQSFLKHWFYHILPQNRKQVPHCLSEYVKFSTINLIPHHSADAEKSPVLPLLPVTCLFTLQFSATILSTQLGFLNTHPVIKLSEWKSILKPTWSNPAALSTQPTIWTSNFSFTLSGVTESLLWKTVPCQTF